MLASFLLFGSAILTGNLAAEQPQKAEKQQPNLIVIHTDEHNFRTLGCYRELMDEEQAMIWGPQAKVETPNIDRIAHQGAISLNYYCSSPVCTPSRASLITGLYPQATGAPKNGEHLREDVPTFAKILNKAGYSTSYVGKWHLDGEENYQFNVKSTGGFTDHRYMTHGGHSKYLVLKDGTSKGISMSAYSRLQDEEKQYAYNVTDYFTDKALEILERDKSKPFCLMISLPDPHTPDEVRPPYNTMFDAMDVLSPKTMSPELVKARPGWAKGGTDDKNEVSAFNANGLRQYFGMVKQIDDNVGRILKFLDDNDLADNTIVVFTSDHGDMYYEHNRMNKGVPYEASARIPFVIRYPQKIAPGKVIRKAYTNVDFAPTILGLMDVSADVPFHGLNTADDFANSNREVSGDRIVYYAKTGGWWVAAVNNRYKLVLDKNEKPWLFDLEKDPDELQNYYNQKGYEAISKKMLLELYKQMKEYDEPGLKIKNRPYLTE